MKTILLAVFLSATIVHADYAHDQYTDHPDVLLRIVTAAENNAQLKSSSDGTMALYLQEAEYIGPLNAPFGTVHVAELFYIRSARKGSNLPSRGHTYIVFLDDKLTVRAIWGIDLPDTSLHVDGSKLMSGKEVVFDYEHLPKNGILIFDGKEQGVPTWDK